MLAPIVGAQEDNVDVYGRELPEDAAPYDMQVMQGLCDANATHTSFMAVVTVYQRICGADQFSDWPIFLDVNMQLTPAGFVSWEPAEDGLSWFFHLDPDAVWNDGTPVTATDFVRSWQFMADPDHAYDFVWMWLGIIEGWDEAVAGEIAPDEIGMVAVDDLTLQVYTQGTIPFLPNTFHFWPPLQAAALGEPGSWNPDYLLDPETAVSSGPFMLKEFTAGDTVVLEANPDYNGFMKPRLRELRWFYGDANTSFLAYQDREVDTVDYGWLSPADFEIIANDAELRSLLMMHSGDFRTDYLVFDTYNPPFDDLNVRLAFAKAVDRAAIAESVINISGIQSVIPAGSMLAPGFPAWDAEGELQDIQAYDCPAAQELLAEAGYPGGEGFPALDLKLRGESEGIQSWYVAVAASISECLGVDISVTNMEYTAYMNALLARPTTLQFGGISYGMDYLDANNLLGLWHSRGRQSWRNAEFDQLVDDAAVLVGDPAAREQMYKDAERILVEDVGGVFLFWRRLGTLYQPYIAGPECWAPDAQGVSAPHWGNEWCWQDYYVTADVTEYDTFRGE
jgi:ABC-type transport system substrate-binding protein